VKLGKELILSFQQLLLMKISNQLIGEIMPIHYKKYKKGSKKYKKAYKEHLKLKKKK